MNKKDEALKLALEALEMWCPMTATYLNTRDEAITAIREALAEQPAQQEPVEEFAYKAITKRGEHCHFGTHAAARIWAGEGGEVETIKLRHLELVEQPAQPSKPWVGLDEEEIEKCCFHADSIEDNMETWKWTLLFYEAVATKLREKNT